MTQVLINVPALAPILLVFCGGVAGVLTETLVPRRLRQATHRVIAYTTIVVAFAVAGINWTAGVLGPAAGGSVSVDWPSYFSWIALLIFGLLSLLLFGERKLYAGATAFAPQAAATPGSADEREAIEQRVEQTELYPLTLFALSGMMLFTSANDLLMMFVALEIFSLPLYVMCGMARRRRLLSQEASMKYFLLGALSSAIFVFGIALVYAFAGSFNLGGTPSSAGPTGLAAAIALQPDGSPILLAGLAMIGVGLLFKVGAVPFASWVPDVYGGAPSPVTAFMAVCTKFAAIIALARVFFVAFGGLRWDWQPVLAVVAVASMIVGSLLAIAQNDVKRMLAYSSIAHAGFLLVPVVGAFQQTGPNQLSSLGAVLFYLVTYGVATMGAFAVLTTVRNSSGEVNRLSAWAGIGRKSPLTAGLFAYFLLSFAGIPLTAGFIGKWAIFTTAWQGGFGWLVIVAVLVSVIAAFFYIRVIVTMFFADPDSGDAEVAEPGWGTKAVVTVSCVLTVALAVVPGWLLTLSAQAGQFLR